MSFITNLTNATPDTGVFNGDGLPDGVDNDQGKIVQGGNISATDKFGSQDIATPRNAEQVTLVSGNHGVDGAVGGHTFNGGTEIQMRSTTSVAGSEVGSILFGGSDSANVSRSINQAAAVNTTYYKTAVRNNKWNESTGQWESGFPQVAASGAWNISDSNDNASDMEVSGTDNSANPSQAVPGELVYMQGNPVPKQDEYDARNNY